MAVKTYDPKANVISVGNLLISGFAENKFLSAKRMEKTFDSKAGCDGEVARSKMNDRRGEVELTLLASAASNDALSALAQLDEQTGGGVGPFQLSDQNGTTLLHSPNCWIEKYPDTELAKDVGEAMWMITCDSLDVFRGGLDLGGI